jgi:hypothetical protein
MRKLKYSIREALYEKESNLYYPYTFDVLDGNLASVCG